MLNKKTSRILFAAAVLNLFRSLKGFNGFGGVQDNSWEIIFTSLLLTLIGFIILLILKLRKSSA